LGRGRTHDLLARGIVLCYTNSFHMFILLFYLLLLLTVATMIHLSEGLCYVTQSHSTFWFCCFYLLLLLTVATRIHLSEGL
jgi:hypothetical protein